MFQLDEEFENSEDYTEYLSKDMDILEDMDVDMLSCEDDCDENEPDLEIAPNINVSVLKISDLDYELENYRLEIDRPYHTFLYDGSIYTGKVLKKVSSEKYIFADEQTNSMKMMKTSNFNK